MTHTTLINTENANSGWLTNRHTGKAYQTSPKPKLKAGQIAARFVESGKRQESSAKRAWPSMQRALRGMERPALYSLSLTTDLGLDEGYEAPDGLFKPAVLELIRGKLQRAFADTFYFVVEVGECGRLHVHAIACADSCLLKLPDDGETVKPIVKGTEYTTFKYFHKESPQLPELIRAHKVALKRTGGRLPFVRGFVRLERLQTTRRRSMWIGHGWRRTRKAMQDRVSAKVRLRAMTNKAKPNNHALYRDSPTEWDIASFAGFSRLPPKRKTKRRVANVTALRA